MQQIKPLCNLAPFTKAVIKSFTNDEFAVKLMEMGFVPDEEILLEITAPLGDPISIMIAGYNLSIRKEDAQHILVQELE